MSTDRIILHSAIADKFKSTVKSLFDENSSAPPPTLVSAASKARVTDVITSALSAGAEVVHGAFEATTTTQPDSDVTRVSMPPVILGNVSQDMCVWKEEIFATLAAYMVVESDDEAIELANEGGYGLSASIFTEDLRKGLAMAKRIQSGAVHINSMTVQDEAALPHGGVKNSGWGRFNSEEGLKEFLVTKSVTWMD
jgi:acyl-CoA reductase-like NAD-dependent aldehyde dehydrogenase